MADSDDEFEKRNVRDKFRHERNDYDLKDDRRIREPPKSTWNRDMRERRQSPPRLGSSPPQIKRMRRDWEEGGYGHHYEGGYSAGHHGMQRPMWPGMDASHATQKQSEPEYPTQPPMQTLKQFLLSQDDNLSEEDAIRRYADYKLDFKKQQINEFFIQHKDEEWFRSKYHPDEFLKRKEEMKWSLRHRREVFQKMMDLKIFDNITLDMQTSLPLIRMLDTAVILMEGGSEYDLKSLDEEYGPLGPQPPLEVPSFKQSADTKKEMDLQESLKNGLDKKEVMDEGIKKENGEEKKDEMKPDKKRDNVDEGDDDASDASSSFSSSSSESDSDEENDKDQKDIEKNKKHDEAKRDKEDKQKDLKDDKNRNISDAEGDGDSRKGIGDDEKVPEQMEKTSKIMEDSPIENDKKIEEKSIDEDEQEKSDKIPKALHKTQSIFLRNLIPAITRQEVESMCKKYPGFVRVSIQDPQPERRFARRGWITFTRDVNVKDICWSLNNIRLRDCDMGAIVNRELKQRVRAVNGLTVHRVVARQDIKHAARIIQHLDNRWKVWQEDDEAKEEQPEFGFNSLNPILKNITDYLVDEASYEDEILLGNSSSKDKDGSSDITIEREEELLKVLDLMLLYLRIVYSIDFYGAFEYPNEDEMPHRCGIIHARGQNTLTKITQADMNEWMSSFESKITPFLHPKFDLPETESIRLGKKCYDDEVEKFIVANMQELGKDKWLCPLSGKKFKGPEFIRKHILSKHLEKIEEVKKEVSYFNNYLNDPRRLQLPEHPSARAPAAHPMPLPMMPGFLGPPPHMGYYRPSFPPAMTPMYPPPFPVQTRTDTYRGEIRSRERERERDLSSLPVRREKLRADPRGMISYTDLDAPADVD